MVEPSRRGPLVERLVGSFQVSERRACRVLCVPRATYRYRSCLDPRTELRMRIREIAQASIEQIDINHGNVLKKCAAMGSSLDLMQATQS